MSNESKMIKYDDSSDKYSKKSFLPEVIIALLEDSIIDGLDEDELDLSAADIDDSMIPELCEWLIKLGDKIRILNLGNDEITSQGVSMLLDMLRTKNSSIMKVYLHENSQIDDTCMKSLGEYIKTNKSIEEIDMSNCQISDAGIEILVPYLEGNTTFRQLIVDCNANITRKSIPFLLKMIESSYIEKIEVHETLVLPKNIISVPLALNIIKYNSSDLSQGRGDLNDDDLIKICEGMKKYGIDKLKEIKFGIDGNKVSDEGINVLSEYLYGNTTLKNFHLSFNESITNKSVTYLLETLMKSGISNLDIQHTSIDDGMQQSLRKATQVPIDQREIPIKSNTKSAAKIQPSASLTT